MEIVGDKQFGNKYENLFNKNEKNCMKRRKGKQNDLIRSIFHGKIIARFGYEPQEKVFITTD